MKNWTVEDIRKIFNDLDEKTGIDSSCIPIRLSSQMKKVLGKVTYYRDNYKVKDVAFATILTDGNYSPLDVERIIIHEYVHVYCLIKHNIVGHCDIFKKYCLELGGIPFAKANITPLTKKEEMFKYSITCKKCNKTFYRHKMNQTVFIKKYCCAKCKGSFDIVVNF